MVNLSLGHRLSAKGKEVIRMTRRKPRRTLTVVPMFAMGLGAPTLEEVRAQAFPVLTRLFVSAMRERRLKNPKENA